MIRYIVLILGLLLALSGSSSAATCAFTSIQVKGNDGTIIQMAVKDDGSGSGNCVATSDPSTATVQGGAANGVATLGNPVQEGCVAVSSETPVLAGQAASVICGLERKVIVLPYANKENMLRCAVAITVNTATTCTGMGAQGAALKIYITSLCITRNDAGTTAISATLNAQDTSATNNIIYDIPNNGGGGGICPPLPTPLVVAANTAFQVTMSAATTTVHVNATGYFGQ